MRLDIRFVPILTVLALLPACGDGGPPPASAIRVQHILIAYKDADGFKGRGGPPPKAANRTVQEARKLAEDLLARAKAGEDFGALVAEFTDDSAPGIYGLVDGSDRPPKDYHHRSKMAKLFGDVSYSLKPGEVGLALFHNRDSPFGYHVIKRLE